MRQNILPTLAFAAGAVVASHEKIDIDQLYSSRMMKRGVDAAGNFNMSFFHINDVHAHLDEFSSSGTDCTRPERGCFGGYARVKHAIDELRPQYENSLFLDAGDEFQGTLFYTFYKGEKIAETVNQLGFDAMTLGNHEFDGGDDELGEFLLNLTFPVLSANIVSTHPALNKTILPYKIYEKHGVAVIGCTTQTTANIANPGPGTEFLDVVSSVQRAIDEIHATTDIKRIVALTHIGYTDDQALAAATTGLSLIMGGHSHTPLGTATPAGTAPQGDYPTIVKNANGDDVFVVQAWRWGQYLGYIDVTFDEEGHALAYHGAKMSWLSRKDTAKAYGSMMVYLTKAADARRLLAEGFFHAGGESGCTAVFERRWRPEQCFNCQEIGHKAFQCKNAQRCGRCAMEGHRHDSCSEEMVKCVPCGGPHESFSRSCQKVFPSSAD